MKFKSDKRLKKVGFGHPYILPTLFIFGFTISVLLAFISFSGETVGAKDSRIVRLNIDGEEKVLTTRSKYVGELVESLHLNLAPQDKVEPSAETPLVEDNQQVNIFSARPVVVVEGQNRVELVSAEQDPKAVATQAGMQISDKDIVVATPYDDSLASGIAAEKFQVFKAVPVNASVYGTLASYQSQAKTVEEFLKENGLSIKEGETLQPEDRKTPLTPGMLISINSPGKKTLAVTEPLKFKVDSKNDPKLQAGQTKVERPGIEGERAVIYEVTIVDGVETARREIQTIVTREPVNEVRLKGTLAAATYSVSADKAALMLAAGIPADQHASVDYIIGRESNWRPGAINSNGCIGLGQRCPSRGTNALANACPNWQTDPVCQLGHFSAYANGRYGSWNSAYSAWQAQHWW